MVNSFLLKQFGIGDFDLYYALVRDERVMAMITERALSLEEATSDFEKMLDNNDLHPAFGYFKIVDGDTFIGLAKLEVEVADSQVAELGYMLLPAYWGMGIGSQVAMRLLEIARSSSQLKTINAIVDPANLPSRKILLNSGFISKGFKDFDGLPGEILEMDIV